MKKVLNNLIILFCIVIVIIGIGVFIYSMHYYNIKLQLIINILIAMIVLFAIIYIPYKIGTDREKLVEDNFILDIYKNDNDKGHIRINENNILFKYEKEIKYWYVFPKFFTLLSLNSELGKTPTYIIKNKIELHESEINNIIKKINELSEINKNEVIINVRGDKKYLKSNEINGILEKYNIEIWN